MSDVILYTSEDGLTRLDLRAEAGAVGVTQMEMAELFQTTKQNISLHVRNILEEGELEEHSVVKESLITASDGKNYKTQLYALPMILAVGYRIRSPRGTQFRQWATRHLREYLLKGFVMDDERLKSPGKWDYFDELLERIREIRASEKRFYQKVRDLFALSADYQAREEETRLFFAETQNKLLFAVTGLTAAELIVGRADAAEPNMALTNWSGSRVRKHDVVVAKNYLSADEVDTLNRLVVIFLEQAELRVKHQQTLTLEFWRGNVDRLLEFNGCEVLEGAGAVSHQDMKKIAEHHFETFDQNRRIAEAKKADVEDLKEIEVLERRVKKSDCRGES